MTGAEPKLVFLVGNPNCGKTTLFNALANRAEKVGNFPGVTIDVAAATVGHIELVDLPGTYSLTPFAQDEELTWKALFADAGAQAPTPYVFAVIDATKLKSGLYLVAELMECGIRPLLLLNMVEEAAALGTPVNASLISERVGLPVVAMPLSSLKSLKLQQLMDARAGAIPTCHDALPPTKPKPQDATSIARRHARVRTWLRGQALPSCDPRSRAIDRVLLHPIWGPLLLLSGLLFTLQALFALSDPLIESINLGADTMGAFISNFFPANSLLASLLSQGVIAGVGSVLAFLPLIGLLFLFQGLLEESGYMPRASFHLHRAMSALGLSGHAVLPIASGFACAVPALMSTRVLRNPKERLIAMAVIPFSACSARLPVYALLIAGAFSHLPPLFGFFSMGAAALIFMYGFGLFFGIITALMLDRVLKDPAPKSFILELPPYRRPRIKPVFAAIRKRIAGFVKEVGTVVLALSIVFWALFAFPRADDAVQQVEGSYAAQLGKWIEPAIAPLGFDWKIGVGLIASLVAREAFVSTLSVIEGDPSVRPKTYPPLVALSLMVFFALSMQCVSTLSTLRRESRSWRWPVFQFTYMTALAYTCSLILFQGGRLLGFS